MSSEYSTKMGRAISRLESQAGDVDFQFTWRIRFRISDCQCELGLLHVLIVPRRARRGKDAYAQRTRNDTIGLEGGSMEDRLRLYIIERELDNTNPDGPFRVGRQRLNREKKRILQRLEGRDPRWFAVGGGEMDYQMKKAVVTIMNEIERR